MHNIIITTECVADLPRELLKQYEIDLIYYDIETEGGYRFRDTDEIDSQNVMEYMIGGHKKAQSVVPTANEFKGFFTRELKEYEEIVHICIGSGSSVAYENAMLARAKMGKDSNHIHIVDSKHLSSGQGLIAIEAAKCRNAGMKGLEIVAHIEKLIPRVSTTFLANNADYLFYNGKVEKFVMQICRTLSLHPVLTMANGKITLQRVYIGNYDKAAARYIKKTLGNAESIDKAIGFVTYAGCDEKLLTWVKNTVQQKVGFEELHEQQASATVSCNCGPKTFGVLFIRKA